MPITLEDQRKIKPGVPFDYTPHFMDVRVALFKWWPRHFFGPWRMKNTQTDVLVAASTGGTLLLNGVPMEVMSEHGSLRGFFGINLQSSNTVTFQEDFQEELLIAIYSGVDILGTSLLIEIE